MQGYGLFGRSDASTPAGIVRTHRKTRICPVASWRHECFAEIEKMDIARAVADHLVTVRC